MLKNVHDVRLPSKSRQRPDTTQSQHHRALGQWRRWPRRLSRAIGRARRDVVVLKNRVCSVGAGRVAAFFPELYRPFGGVDFAERHAQSAGTALAHSQKLNADEDKGDLSSL